MAHLSRPCCNRAKWSCFILFLSLSFWCKRSIFICKLFFKGFVACGLPATHFLKDLILAGLPQIIPQKVWRFRAWRKSFPEWFGVSALGESHFPNSLDLVVAKIWNKNLSGFWIYNYQGASIGTVSMIFSTYFVLHKKSFYGIN